MDLALVIDELLWGVPAGWQLPTGQFITAYLWHGVLVGFPPTGNSSGEPENDSHLYLR